VSSNEAEVIAVIGATGSGKGVFIKNYALKKSDRRLLIWDYMQEYSQFVDLSTDKLGQVIRGLSAPHFRMAFRPSYDDKQRAKQFDAFCKAAVEAGNVRVVVEELAFVTQASHAPAGWKMATSIGRHKGLRLIGASQRPAQVDKAFWSNCTEIHCGFLNYDDDQKVMAKALGVEVADIKSLEPLEYFHKNVRTKKIIRGKVKIGGAA
jgi:hypothetical protein